MKFYAIIKTVLSENPAEIFEDTVLYVGTEKECNKWLENKDTFYTEGKNLVVIYKEEIKKIIF